MGLTPSHLTDEAWDSLHLSELPGRSGTVTQFEMYQASNAARFSSEQTDLCCVAKQSNSGSKGAQNCSPYRKQESANWANQEKPLLPLSVDYLPRLPILLLLSGL
ncbi:hypothetical protein ElyMa_003956000 [Elysia marginata]|uniref:Uncharacterized protein n=1 Tax=Elysia marginata TaxID=1093978 RepID=A0AAV4FTY3_9GAST|nr:hypothetical protein ElyMa_003956000 [Elysia marginata]